MAKARPWRERVGGYGNSYTLYEDRVGGPVYVRTLDREASRRARHSRYHVVRLTYPTTVRHPDGTLDDGLVTAAKAEAKLIYDDLVRPTPGRAPVARTMKELLDRWLDLVSDRRPEYVKDQRRLVELWTTFLGPRRDPATVVGDDLVAFKKDREPGVIDARGNRVARVSDRRKVGPRIIEADLVWFVRRLRWGVANRHLSSIALTAEDVKKVTAPLRKRIKRNRKRPVAGETRYRKTLAKAGETEMTVRRKRVRSYLAEFLPVLHATGVRVRVLLDLRIDDLHLDEGEHGVIHWRPSENEHGKERPASTPLSADARAAIDEQLTRRVAVFGVDVAAESPYVFPSPRSPVRLPWSYSNAAKVLGAAEKLAGLSKLERGVFHPYRRKWVTERRHHTDADVAAAQGRSDVDVMRASYQGTDLAGRQRIVDDAEPVEDDQYLP